MFVKAPLMALMIYGTTCGMTKSAQFPMTALKELTKDTRSRLSELPPQLAQTIQLQVFARCKLTRSQVIRLLEDSGTYFATIPRDIWRYVIYPMVFAKPNIVTISGLLNDRFTRFVDLSNNTKKELQAFMQRVAADDLAPTLVPFDGSKELCLFSAVERSDAQLVKQLVFDTINANHERDFETPLWMAVRRGDLDIASMLLAAGADPNMLTSRELPIFICNLRTSHPSIAEGLIARGAAVAYAPVYDNRPLFQAVRLRDSLMVELLLENGTNPDTITYPEEPIAKQDYGFGATALCVAASCHDPDIVRLLLAAGSDRNKANAFGQRPLDIALREGPQETVEALTSSPNCEPGLEPIKKFCEKLWDEKTKRMGHD